MVEDRQTEPFVRWLEGLRDLKVPVITTINPALAAHVSASRYEKLVVTCLHTARNLEVLRVTRGASGLSDAAFIDVCEALLAAENRGWRISSRPSAWTGGC
jgi:hypothetical protein